MKKYLVFDAGGTFTKYALMNENAEILEKDKVATPDYRTHTKEEYYQILDGVVSKYKDQVEGIAISMPGMLDNKNGYCVTAGYLAYLAGSTVGDELSERYGLPVSVENDGKCAALAEYWRGSLKGCENGAVVVLGSGVAGGIIINGKIYRGNHFTAGEYSYVCTDVENSEEMNSYWGLVNGAEGLAKAVAKYTGEDWKSYNGVKIFERANAGDNLVQEGLKEFTHQLAVQIYNLNIYLDLDVIAIGGGISQQPLLHEYLQKSLDEYLQKIPLRKITPYVPEPKLTNCKFYNDANLIGALYHFMNSKGEQ